ncbi:MAG: hypothetical protein HFACDABA_02339 [Anaerolineales bacterium]|nr:hypothetical protein [Anaerolineales bacterium]
MTAKTDRSHWAVYRAFGVDIISDHAFSRKFHPGVSPPSLRPSLKVRFSCSQSPPFSTVWREENLLFYWRTSGPDGERWNKFYHFDDYDVFRFAGDADFYISDERIDCCLWNPAYKPAMELQLMGLILAFWLETKGIFSLHASAVTTEGGAAVFPAQSGSGKSTLAAIMVQAGARLLTDDVLPIEQEKRSLQFWGWPGLPQINLWPDPALRLLEDYTRFDALHSDTLKKRIPVEGVQGGTFCRERQPLTCIYFPNRVDAPMSNKQVEISPFSPAEAVIRLMDLSFVGPGITARMGWEPQKLDFLSRLAARIPVRKLNYPNGVEYLPRISEAIMEDLENLPRPDRYVPLI